jgi:uncharacterized protein YheU (UPF0270 family)
LSQFVEVPARSLQPDTLQRLLEEFASRDGTDYGMTETSLAERVAQLRRQLDGGTACLLFDSAGESWDIVSREQAALLLVDGTGGGHEH